MPDFKQRAFEDATRLVRMATERNLTVSTAESCTAGLVSATVASVPGASAVLRGGAVTYLDEIKSRVLHVSRETLARCTAVSAPCAREMAIGSRGLFGSDCAVSVTGFAGPGGGTDSDPVGTVYFAVATEGSVRDVREVFPGNRDEVRWQATCRAISLLLDACGESV